MNTLAYYRAQKTPLTLVQLGRYLVADQDESFQLSEIETAINELIEKKIVAEQKGLFWLNLKKESSPKTWLKFVHSEKISQRKINKALKAINLFAFVPNLRALFICGSVARKVSRADSDIDFLILTKPDHIWTVRFLLTLFAFLLGKKTNDAKLLGITDSQNTDYSRRNKFCLNHYRSSANLKLEEPLRDLYSAQEYACMLNIYSENRTDRKFFKKNKLWMRKIIPNFNFSKLPFKENGDNFPNSARRFLEKMLGGKIGHIIERLLYQLQLKKINLSNRGLLDNQRIIAEKEVIMFHLNPRSPLVLRRHQQVINNYE